MDTSKNYSLVLLQPSIQCRIAEANTALQGYPLKSFHPFVAETHKRSKCIIEVAKQRREED